MKKAEARTERLSVKITPTMLEELERLSADIGQPTSTLAAVYLGDAINKKRIERENSERIAQSVGDAFKEMFEPMMNAFEKVQAEEMANQS